jgi:hypothetical protein
MRDRGKLALDADPAALATATMAAALLLTQIRREPEQLRIALGAARALLRAASLA